MTTNIQIENYYRNHPKWGGCLMQDQLQDRKPDGLFYIVNLDLNSGPGTHWVAIVDFTKTILYIDPYGLSPEPTYIRPFMKRSKHLKNGKALYSRIQFQKLKSINCALFCIEFIDELLKRPWDLEAFDDDLSQGPSTHNEKEVTLVKL